MLFTAGSQPTARPRKLTKRGTRRGLRLCDSVEFRILRWVVALQLCTVRYGVEFTSVFKPNRRGLIAVVLAHYHTRHLK